MAYVRTAEQDKLYYFTLASLNPQPVLIVKSPSKTTEIKEFLGYEWSSAKGNEGIKYLGGVGLDEVVAPEDEDAGEVALEEEDKRVLSNIFNLNNINTPLYDPRDKSNPSKINHLIAQNFSGERVEILEEAKGFVILSPLIEMMNFELTNFNKSISLSPNSTIKVETKWNTAKLSQVVDFVSGGTPSTSNPEYWDGDIPWLSVKDFNNEKRYVFETEKSITQAGFDNSNTNYIEPDDIILSARGTVGAFAQVGRKMTFNQSCYGLRAKKEISNSYLYYILGELLVQFKAKAYGSKFDSITIGTFDEIMIPLPPPEVQQQIVAACQAIDQEFEEAEKTIDGAKKEMEQLFSDAFAKANELYRLSDTDIFEIAIGKRVLKSEINQDGVGIPVYSANVMEPFGHINKQLLEDFIVPSVLWGIDGDWMVNYLPAEAPFYPTDHCGVLRVSNGEIHPRYLAWALAKEGERVRFSRHNRASMDSIKGLSVKAPSIEIQTKLISEIEKIEATIRAAQDLMRGIASKKEVVIRAFL